jgi:hypothetical protein
MKTLNTKNKNTYKFLFWLLWVQFLHLRQEDNFKRNIGFSPNKELGGCEDRKFAATQLLYESIEKPSVLDNEF